MRLVGLFIYTATVFVCAFALSAAVHAESDLAVTPSFDPSSIKTDSPVIISGFGYDGPNLKYIQLFNESDQLVDLDGWYLQFMLSGVEEPVVLPAAMLGGFLEPSNYVIVSKTDATRTPAVSGADFGYMLSVPPELMTSRIVRIDVVPPGTYLIHSVEVDEGEATNFWMRNRSTTTGNYLSSFSEYVTGDDVVLYGGGLYYPPISVGLQISAIMPNSRECSPAEIATDCQDFVKLYNPTTQTVDLSQFRLRNGHKGQVPTGSNSFSLVGTVGPGAYAVIQVDGAGESISLTDSGEYVWLEDTYGIKMYDTTVMKYPSAGGASKVGWAWAYDESDGDWKWTSSLAPLYGPNVFLEVTPQALAASTSDLKPCNADQYRNSETNRCRLLATASSSLKPCNANQYRSKETNRCRLFASATSSLVPCKKDQARNPATNRCRSVLGASTSLKPCAENQTRNPATNRCKNNVVSVPQAAFAVEPMKQSGEAFVGWWALGGVGLLAVGYGVWEWRVEMMSVIQKMAMFFTSSK